MKIFFSNLIIFFFICIILTLLVLLWWIFQFLQLIAPKLQFENKDEIWSVSKNLDKKIDDILNDIKYLTDHD